MTILNTILRQNYYSFLGQIYQPDNGVAMSSPILGTMADIFLHQLENSIIKHLIDAKILSYYTRYVDGILLIYDSTRTNPENILHCVDTIHSNIQLSPTMESENNIHFLNLSIIRRPNCPNISIFPNPPPLTPPSISSPITRLSIPLPHPQNVYTPA